MYICYLLLHNDILPIHACVTIQWKKDVMIWTNANIVKYVSLIVYCCWYYPIWEMINCFFRKEYHSLRRACVCEQRWIYGIFNCNDMLNGFAIVESSLHEEKNIILSRFQTCTNKRTKIVSHSLSIHTNLIDTTRLQFFSKDTLEVVKINSKTFSSLLSCRLNRNEVYHLCNTRKIVYP